MKQNRIRTSNKTEDIRYCSNKSEGNAYLIMGTTCIINKLRIREK